MRVLRRSHIEHRLSAIGAAFEEVAGGWVAMEMDRKGDTLEKARRLGLCDLSPLPRAGFKGPGTTDWLEKMRVSPPKRLNQASLSKRVLIASLSWEEQLFLNAPSSDVNECAPFIDAWSFDSAPGCYPLPRDDTHCWFAATGKFAADMLAKLCGVDFRLHKFADGTAAQTQLARIEGIVIRNDLGGTPAFYLLADSASANYLWSCLEDAMNEFEGVLVGLTALRAMAEAGK